MGKESKIEPKYKVMLAGAGGVLLLLILIIITLFQQSPTIIITANYPSLVFKPSDFEIQFSLKNVVPDTFVKNILKIDSGSIKQLDNIPSDCEKLTDQERICEESLSFQVDNNTLLGTNKMKFSVTSSSPLNFPLISKFIQFSEGSSSLEIPINVETPQVERLNAQVQLNHSKPNVLILAGIFLLIAIVTFGILLIIFFCPQLLEFIRTIFNI